MPVLQAVPQIRKYNLNWLMPVITDCSSEKEVHFELTSRSVITDSASDMEAQFELTSACDYRLCLS